MLYTIWSKSNLTTYITYYNTFLPWECYFEGIELFLKEHGVSIECCTGTIVPHQALKSTTRTWIKKPKLKPKLTHQGANQKKRHITSPHKSQQRSWQETAIPAGRLKIPEPTKFFASSGSSKVAREWSRKYDTTTYLNIFLHHVGLTLCLKNRCMILYVGYRVAPVAGNPWKSFVWKPTCLITRIAAVINIRGDVFNPGWSSGYFRAWLKLKW